MKKICHLTSAHNRYDVRIFEKECVSLSKAGYDVFLLVNDDLPDEIRCGVHIISTNLLYTSRKERFSKGISLIFTKAVEIDAELYHFHDAELLLAGMRLKKLGKKVIFDSHENTPGQILEKDWIPLFLRKIISIIYEYYERLVGKKLDGIISVTPKETARMKKINKNVAEICNFPIVEGTSRCIRTKEKIICFTGGVSEQWMHSNIIEAINKISDVKYLIAGQASSEYMVQLTNLDGWDKVEYIGVVSFDESKKLHQFADVGMAVLRYNQNTGGRLGTLGNTKLFEYMMAGIPTICTDFILWKEIIDKYHCGICINPYDIDEISKAISYLLDNPEVAIKMGKNGEKAVHMEFNWNTQEKKLLILYETIFSN